MDVLLWVPVWVAGFVALRFSVGRVVDALRGRGRAENYVALCIEDAEHAYVHDQISLEAFEHRVANLLERQDAGLAPREMAESTEPDGPSPDWHREMQVGFAKTYEKQKLRAIAEGDARVLAGDVDATYSSTHFPDYIEARVRDNA
jgi:hypothetical protein